MYQQALLLTVCKLLNYKQCEDSPYSILAWAQDPAYGPVDAAILAESGVSLLENPDGFLIIDDSTLILSFAAGIPVKQIITEISRPAAMLWNKVTENEANESSDGTLW
jgi:SRR1